MFYASSIKSFLFMHKRFINVISLKHKRFYINIFIISLAH